MEKNERIKAEAKMCLMEAWCAKWDSNKVETLMGISVGYCVFITFCLMYPIIRTIYTECLQQNQMLEYCGNGGKRTNEWSNKNNNKMP